VRPPSVLPGSRASKASACGSFSTRGRTSSSITTSAPASSPPPIDELLQCRLDVELPYDIFKRQIFGYRLHAGKKEILLVGEPKTGATYAVRRVVFDRFLLGCAKKEGVEVSRSRVTAIDFPK
jgi:hypothetical protein